VSEILDLAERLGKAIAGSPQVAKLRQAQKALEGEQETAKLLTDYQQQADRIAQLEADKKPIEPEDKRKLQDLHDALVASDVFKKYTMAQVDYVDLMRSVNDKIQQSMGDVE